MSDLAQSIPIQDLQTGSRARVAELSGDSDEVVRLAALGIHEGIELSSLRNGCPCIVQFGCSRMCIRTSGQLRVMVTPVS
jgi:Fe2+ transport system protein FeoA